MRKKAAKPIPASAHALAFQALQKEWYSKLSESGFEDAEDTGVKGFEDGRPLKKWSGISNWIPFGDEESFDILDLEKNQPPESPIISSWPEPFFSQEENFSNHPDFTRICVSICKHGNSKCTPETAIAIWSDYCAGNSERSLENRYGISDTAIRRILTQLTEWMNMMAAPEDESESAPIKVIIRAFIPETDSAFLFSSWRNNLWYDEERDNKQSHAFYSATTKAIKRLLLSPTLKINIACSSQDPDHIIGYAVFTGTNLEFCYIKIEYREKGIATLLTKGFQTVSPPPTKIGQSIVSTHELKIKENSHGTQKEEPARIPASPKKEERY